MATATEYASGASGTSWTTPTNANADDAAYATYTIAAKNTTGNVNTLTSFGFDSSIPAGSTINSVALEVEHKVSTTGGIAFLESALAIGATIGTYNSDSAEPTTDTARSYASMARPGGGTWTRDDLLDATFTVKLRARSGNNATSVVYSWDYARVVVDYTAVSTGTLAATESGADTFAGSGTVAWGVITGSMAATEGADVLAATGDVIVQGPFAAIESGSDTFAASGTVADASSPVTGAMAAAESSDAFAAAGNVLVRGAMAATESGVDSFSASSTPPEAETALPSGPWGRRFLHDGILFNIDEDDEELLMMLAAAVPLLNRGNHEIRMH